MDDKFSKNAIKNHGEDRETIQKKSSNKMVVIILAVLFGAVLILVFLNREYVAEKKVLMEKGAFLISSPDGINQEVTIDDLLSMGIREVEGNYKPSKNPVPEKRIYEGLPFIEILKYFDIESKPYKSVSFRAIDGYATATDIEKAIDPSSCWIIIKEAGEPLGNKESGGSGPIRMIFPTDQFSQSWVSFLTDIELIP